MVAVEQVFTVLLFIYLSNSPCIMHTTTATYTMAGNPQQHVSQLLRSQELNNN